jgi:molybdate transport system ATP-binding protein
VTVALQDIALPLADFTLEISLEIDAPSTAIYGPSGSGKTSLLEIIAGLRKPIRGRVVLNGRDQTDADPADRRVGYVPQDDALFPHMSVRRNILYGARESGPFFLDHVARVLELEPIMARGVEALSGGERKRVALARALLTPPDLLLLDEPLTGIDVELRKRVLDYLVRVREEFPVPIIYVTHQMEEAAVICDAVIVMERGKVVSRKT